MDNGDLKMLVRAIYRMAGIRRSLSMPAFSQHGHVSI
jgi:hypothetical protein